MQLCLRRPMAVGISQTHVSKPQRRTDLYVRALREYVEALGNVLEIRARFPNGEIAVINFGAADTKIIRATPKRREHKTTSKRR